MNKAEEVKEEEEEEEEETARGEAYTKLNSTPPYSPNAAEIINEYSSDDNRWTFQNMLLTET